jgi:GT2 family glycosyltransferase
MLSILVPVYKYDFRQLISFLNESASASGIDYEIICLDDGSGNQYDHLFELNPLAPTRIKYVRLETNIGRSAARNKLANLAQYAYLLFLDNDVMPLKQDFISFYLAVIEKYDVICGGRIYKETAPDNNLLKLHWKYGITRESKNASQRFSNPYAGFHSNNFAIKKSIYQRIKFDEILREYGHEDTLFGIELEKAGVKIIHIDNPVEHLDLENWDRFLDKSIYACKNAVYIYINKHIFVNNLTLISVKATKLGLAEPLIWILKILKSQLMKNLSSDKPNLFSLDLIRMLYTLMEIKTQKQKSSY